MLQKSKIKTKKNNEYLNVKVNLSWLPDTIGIRARFSSRQLPGKTWRRTHDLKSLHTGIYNGYMYA